MAKPFTPEQISQILEEFFKVVGTRQYIGARYVPIFGRKGEESIEWDNSAPYEPLTIVLYQGNSYTSRQYVPVGVEITNQEFWAITGNYNAQVELYRQEVRNLLPYDETPTEDSTKAVTSDGIKKAIAAETTRATTAEETNATAIAAETTRATTAEETNATAIANEVTRAKEAEQTNATAIANEVTRAKEAEQTNATAIANEVTRAKEAEKANATAIANEVTRAKEAEKANSISVNPNYAILTIKKIGSIPISTGRSAGGMTFNPITNQLVIGTHQNDDTNCALAFVNYDEENESATYIESKPIARKSHMNSLCYYNNKIYCFDWNQNRDSVGNCNGFTGFDLSSNSEFGGNIFMGNYSSFAIFDGSSALFQQGTAKPVLVAKQDHAQNLMIYVGTDINYFVPALSIPLSSTDFGNSYAQDCHATNTAFYSLYSRSEDNSQTLINVSNYSGNSSINLFIPSATSELEGITKLSGANYFLLVDSLGNIYKTSEIKLQYNSSMLSIETINNIFYKYSNLYYNYEDSNVGQTIIKFANNGYIVKSFTRPFNRLYYEGKSAVLANVFASSKEMSGFLRFTFTIYKNNNSYNFTLVYSSSETAAAQSYQLALTNDSFCNVIKSDNSVEHITLENFNTLPLAIKLPFANEALGLTGHRNIPLPYSTLHI